MQSVGRPTKYNEERLQEAQGYVAECLQANTIPFIEELALKLDVHDDTLVEWGKEHTEFSATMKKLKMLQKLHLKKGTLEKKLQPTFAIFLLKANHGMNEEEKEEVEPMSVTVKFVGVDPKNLEEAIEARKKAEEAEEKFQNMHQEI
jgi:hypothetical protein